MLSHIFILIFLFSGIATLAQNPFNSIYAPKAKPDTLYFPFDQEIQLIIIDRYDTWKNQVDYKEQTQPMGSSLYLKMGSPPKNIYLFRNKAGNIIKSYPAGVFDTHHLKDTDYINTTFSSINTIRDYTECNKHLMIYDEKNKVGLINLKGDIVLPTIYDEIRKYQGDRGNGNKLVVHQGVRFGFLDANLNVLFPPIYSTSKDTNNYSYPELNILNNNYIKVFKNAKCGLIDENGKLFIDFVYDDIRVLHDSIYMCMVLKDESELKDLPHTSHWDLGYRIRSCVLYDQAFKVITEMKDYEYIYYWGVKRFIVKKDNKFGVIDHCGKVVVSLDYDHVSSKNGDYCVVKNKKFGMINLEGKIVLSIEFDALDFYEPAIYVTQNGLIGVYSKDYKLIASPQFIHKNWDMGKYVLTRKDGSKGFVLHEKNAAYYQSPEGMKINF